MASNSKNLAELLNSDVTLTATDIANGAVTTDKIADGAVTAVKTTSVGKAKNIIINGDFKIAQRATSVSSTDGSNEDYSTVDRWFFRYGNNAPGTMTISQETDVPSGYGFSNSWKFDVTATGTATGDHHTLFSQFIEARTLRYSGWDYTNPSSYVTLSFWVKSTKTGTYCITFDAADVAGNFKFIKEYTIDSASTWEKKTISIPGHASLVFDDDAERGCELGWNLASGGNRDNATDNTWYTADASRVTPNQVNFLDDTANNLWITGVQLEVGSFASDFEIRTHAEELVLCQRYYEISREGISETKSSFGGGAMTGFSYSAYTGTGLNATSREGSRTFFKVTKRAIPTVTPYSYGGTANGYSYITGGGHSTNYGIRVRHEGFNMYLAAVGGIYAWFDWEADAEL